MRGELVGMPTETVYGLAADARNERAVASIFAAKGRPRFNPLIIHVPDLSAARAFAVVDARAERLAAAFWPGPLTLVLPRRPSADIAWLASAGLDTLAIRAPAHPAAQALLRACACPLAAPSANRSGHVSPTTADHVAAELGDALAVIVDGGPCPVGLESAIVDLSGASAELLRPGAITRADLAAQDITVSEAAAGTPAQPRAPGQLASHYAPAATVRLDVQVPAPGEAFLSFGPDVPAHDGPTINLSPKGDLREAAAGLFASMRTLDATGVDCIAVSPIPTYGLGEAIRDRLMRAAAPRK